MDRQYTAFILFLCCSQLLVGALAQLQPPNPFGDLQGDAWQRQTRTQKLNRMVNLQFDNLDTANFPPAPNESELVSYEFIVDPIFETATDQLPLYNPSGSGDAWQPVPKAQAQGVIASATWTPALKNPYSGLFRTGCQDALVRLSLTAPPTTEGILPGFAIKCLKDGYPSANVLAQPSLSFPQKSYNFFAQDYTNHPVSKPLDNQTSTEKIINDLYLKNTAYPTMLGLSKFAELDQNGRREATVKFPYRIIFHPVDSLHFGIPDTAPPAPNPWYYYLLQLNPGPLFEVYGQPEPEDQDKIDRYIHLGTVSTTRKFIPGKFGDIHLSFEHTYMERDFEFYPSRIVGAREILKKQSLTFRYKNLPWNNATRTPVLPEPEYEPEGENPGVELEAVDIILIIFICFAFLVLLVVLAVILRSLFCYGTGIADYNELY